MQPPQATTKHTHCLPINWPPCYPCPTQHHHRALHSSSSGGHSYGLVGGTVFGAAQQPQQQPQQEQQEQGRDSCPGQAAAHAVCLDWGLPAAGCAHDDGTSMHDNYTAWCATEARHAEHAAWCTDMRCTDDGPL
jgi:hypothetical protein